jgi:hypothetical protein
VKRKDRDAMRRAIEWMRQESQESREQIDHKLKHEGFEEAGEFAAFSAQCSTLRLKPWECAPCNIWGYDQSNAVALRDRMVAAGISIFEPDPTQALAKAEQQGAVR